MYSPHRWQRIVTPASGIRRFYRAPRIESTRDSGMIAGVILSGGQSSRMGRAKELLPIGRSDTFVSRLTRTFHAAGVEDVVVVLGADAPAIRAHIEREQI